MPKYEGDMGWICVDGANVIDHQDDSTPNQQIPKPGTPSRWDKNPPISYGMALEWCLVWIYNLHIDHPSKDLLMLPNNISAAFHQIFYHPRMMPVFALVFDSHLCIPDLSLVVAVHPGFIFGRQTLGLGSWSYQILMGMHLAHATDPVPSGTHTNRSG